MTKVRDGLASPGSTSRQDGASASKAPRRSSLPAKSSLRSAADAFSKEGGKESGLRLFGRLLSNSDGPSQAVSAQATATSVGERPSQPAYPFDGSGNAHRVHNGKRNRLTDGERQEILSIFTNDKERSSTSIARAFGVSVNRISMLRQQFGLTGNVDPRYAGRRLTAEERQEISQIFANCQGRMDKSIAEQYRVSPAAISKLRKQFDKNQNIDKKHKGTELTAERHQELVRVLINNPTRSIRRLASDFGVNRMSMARLRKRIIENGNIDPNDKGKRLAKEDIDKTNRPVADQEQDVLAGSSKMASGDKNSKRPANNSVESARAREQKRARIDSAPLCAEQAADPIGSAGIRIFGVQLYPEKAAQDSQHGNQT